MSADSLPISPTRFAAALPSLPLSTLALKAAELRNSIAHLDYSNEQLKPFAESTPPDQDCVDAIKENEVVIQRMLERIELLKVEVEGRGVRWEELAGEGEKEERTVEGYGREMGEGEGEAEERSEAWRDGTFTTGRIVNGEVRMDGVATGDPGSEDSSTAANGVGAASSATANGVPETTGGTGGRLDDEALRRAMEERMRSLGEEDADEGGMHL